MRCARPSFVSVIDSPRIQSRIQGHDHPSHGRPHRCFERRPSAFYGTGVAELLRTLRRSGLVIAGGATNRGVETSVREAFSMDLDTVVVRECCWGGDAAAHAYSLDKSMKMYARVRTLRQTLAMLA